MLPERLPESAVLLRVTGDAPGDWFGYSVAGLGDVDGDGVPDFAVGAHQNENFGHRPAPDAAPGYVRVYSGAGGEELYTLHSTDSANIDGSDDHFGYSLTSVEDLDGDGVREVFVGAYLYDAGDDDPESVDENTGGAFLFSGATGELLKILPGVNWGDRFGYVVETIPDLDGDGLEDLLIGVEKADVEIENQGSIQILSSADYTELVRTDGPGYNAHLGCAVTALGDVDGDGRPDFAGGAFLDSLADKSEEGAAEVFSGATGEKLFAWRGDAPNDNLGYSIAGLGDVDGDGFDELAVGARQSGWVGEFHGPGYVRVFSTATGAIHHEQRGDALGDQFGWSLARVDDRDGDGRSDYLVGAPAAISVNRKTLPDRPGRLHLVSGATGLRLKTVEGLAINDQFGCEATEIGDLDGDGLAEILVGAPQNVLGQTQPGYAVVIAGSYFATSTFDELARGAEIVLAELASAEAPGASAGAPPNVDPARVAWLHHAALWLGTERAWVPSGHAPGHTSALDLVRHIHAVWRTLPPAPEARARATEREWHAVVRLRERGAVEDARELLGLALAGEATVHTPLLVLEAAEMDRACGRLAEAVGKLDTVARLLDEEGFGQRETAGFTGLEARVRWLRLRGALALDLGGPARASASFQAAYEQALALPESPARRRLLAGTFADRLDAARAAGAWDEVDGLWSEAQQELDFAQLEPAPRALVQLAYALALADRELEQQRPEGAAVAFFEQVLATEQLAPADELRARVGLASTLLDLGRGPRAIEEIAAARLRSGSVVPACAADRPPVEALALSTLEARATRAGMARGADVADALDSLNRLEANFEADVEGWSHDASLPPGSAFPGERERDAALSELVNLCLLVHGEEQGAKRALDWVLRAQTTGSLGRRLALEAPSHGDVQHELIPPRGGVLVFLPGRDSSHALAVTRKEVTHFRLGPQYRIARAAERLGAALRSAPHAAPGSDPSGSRSSLARARTRLSHLLFPPKLREHVQSWKAATIVGSCGAPYVPFEILELTESGALCGERLAVGYVPTLPFGLWLARRAPHAPAKASEAQVLVVGSAGTETLVAGMRERLLASCGLAAVTARTDASSPPARLLEGADTDTVGLHLIAPMVGDSMRAGPERLALDAGEHLDAASAGSIEWPPLVVLSAHGPWRGPLRRGDDGRANLASSMLIGGARALLLTNLGDDAGLGHLAAAYAEMTRHGLSPAEALRRVRVESRRDSGTSSDDASLARFHVVGLAHEPPFEKPLDWLPLLVGGLVGAGAAAAWMLLRGRQDGLRGGPPVRG